MLSTPLPKFAISFRFAPAWASREASISSVTVGTSTSALFTASTSSAWRHRPVVDVEPGVEELAHARLDRRRAAAGDDDERLLLSSLPTPAARRSGPAFTHPLNHREAIGSGGAAAAWRSAPRPPRTETPARALTIRCEADHAQDRSRLALLTCGAAVRACDRANRRERAAARACRCRATSASRPTGSTSGKAPRRTTAPPGSSSAPACRSRSSPNSRPGGASAIRRAPRAGCCTRCCPAGAPPSSRPGPRAWRAARPPRTAGGQRRTSVARLQPGVITSVKDCGGAWCRSSSGARDVAGYIRQEKLWGVYRTRRWSSAQTSSALHMDFRAWAVAGLLPARLVVRRSSQPDDDLDARDLHARRRRRQVADVIPSPACR